MGKKNPKCCYKKCKNRIEPIMIMTGKNKCSKCNFVFCNDHRLPETHICIPKQKFTKEEHEKNIKEAINNLSVNPDNNKIDKI